MRDTFPPQEIPMRSTPKGLARGAVLLGLATLAAACSDQAEPLRVTAAEPGTAAAAAYNREMGGVRRDLRQTFREIAQREVPGFAGMIYDTTGTPIVFLTDPSRRAQAQAALRPFLQQPRRFAGGRGGKTEITVRQARYDYVQLTDWYRPMVQSLLDMPGLALTSVDDARNQLLVGVMSAAAVPEATRRAQKAGVPRDAFRVEVTPLRALASPSALNGTWDSIPGGTRVRIVNPVTSAANDCTMGFNVADPEHTSERWFATAAHCTSDFGSYSTTNPDRAYHNWTPGRYMGTEGYDAPWSVNAQWYWYNPYLYGPQCPSGAVCRSADVAWFKYDTATWGHGNIARPSNTNAYPSGSYLAINSTSPIYRITNGAWYAMSGETVSKVGGHTGMTTGTIAYSCTDIYWQTGSTPKVILCNQVASGNGGDVGDSGAPVFQETGNGEVTLIGILTMAYQPTINPEFNTVTLGYFVFSPWEGIMPEIPPTFGWPTYWR
jgi:hypothetical protein